MTENRQLLAVCGLYCGACYHYRASFPQGRHLLELAARHGRDLEGFACKGCRSGALYVHPGCAECPIRACADEKGFLHCGVCAEFPCEQIRGFQNDGRVHHRDVIDNLTALADQGPDCWLADQARRWTCECGAQFSWYEARCADCGADLASCGSDPWAT